MGVGEAVIVAGIGCRKDATEAQIEAALTAAGPKSQLILPRITVGPVTCALASDEEAP
jgi:hypothetical protein